ncbi:MAG TPA: hypothetical protein VGH79_07080 [Gaiellaceae bacterium]
MAVLVAGCGGGTSAPPAKTLSHGRFLYLAHHILCPHPNRKGAATGKPTTYQGYVRQARKDVSTFEGYIARLRNLTPPAADAGRFHHLLTVLDKIDGDLHSLLDVVGSHDVQSVHSLGRRLKVLEKRLMAPAKKLHLRSCVKK